MSCTEPARSPAMNALLPLRAVLVLSMTVATLMLQASCARSLPSDVDFDPPLFSPDAKNPAPLSVCVQTECPAPWATCPGGGLCTTDTSRDVQHCGSCNPCPKPPRSHHATAVCTGSKCAYACDELSADCNHDPADGCEVFTGNNPNNCGGCGDRLQDRGHLLEGRLRMPQRLHPVRR